MNSNPQKPTRSPALEIEVTRAANGRLRSFRLSIGTTLLIFLLVSLQGAGTGWPRFFGTDHIVVALKAPPATLPILPREQPLNALPKFVRNSQQYLRPDLHLPVVYRCLMQSMCRECALFRIVKLPDTHHQGRLTTAHSNNYLFPGVRGARCAKCGPAGHEHPDGHKVLSTIAALLSDA